MSSRSDSPVNVNLEAPKVATRSEVYFIDASVPDPDTLMAGMGENAEIVFLEAGSDGVEQMAHYLSDRSGIDAIHVISHGSEGAVYLGDSSLNNDSLERYQATLGSIGNSLSEDGDILLYGCSVGEGEDGQNFIRNLALATNADIAASDDITGKGGDWVLEQLYGSVETALGINEAAQEAYQYDLETFIGGGGNTSPYTETQGTLTVTISSTGGVSAGAGLNGVGGISGDSIYTSAAGTMTITFDSPVDVTSIRVVNSNAVGQVIVLTPNTGSPVSTPSLTQFSGTNQTVNFSGITWFTLTFQSGTAFEGAVDDIIAVSSATPPVISVDNSSLAYTEGNAATQVDGAATVSDADGDADWNGGTLEAQITANAEAGDRISIVDSDGDGTAITISGTNIFANGVDIGDLSASGGIVAGGTKLTITFDADATNANVQEVLQSIRYDSTTDDPGTSNRTVTFTATDKNADSNSDTRTIVMTAVNDEPTLTATGSDPTFTEGGAAASLFSGSSISTIESGQTITGLSFTITNVTNGSNERINVDGTTVVLTHGTNGSTAGNSLNYSVMVIGTTATVTMTGGSLSSAAAQTLIDNMSYQNNSNSPSTSNRVVTLTSIQDSGGTANGGDNTGSLAVASTVTLVQNNDEPTLTSNSSNPTFTEGGAAGSLFNGTSISTVEAGQTIKGLTFTVSNVTDGINEVVNIDGTAIVLTHSTSGSTAGNSLSYSVNVVGTTATIALTGGTLSTATTQTLIDNMSYQNNSNTPSTSNRVVTLTSVQDSGGTANSGDDTATLAVASTVTVVGVNDEPTLTATGSDPTFTEGGAAASLFTNTNINTVESGQTITGLSFTITNVTNGSNERINVDGTTVVLTHGTNGSTAGNSLNYSVMVIGTTATVTMTGGSLSVAAAQTLIDNMSYQNNSNSPSTSNRVVTLTSIQDSGGTANGGDNTGSLAVASTVTLVQNNDEPTLTSNGSNPTFTEGGAAGSLFNGTNISTVEAGQTIKGFSFTVSNVANGINEVVNIDGTAIVLAHGTSGSTAGNNLSYTTSVVGTTATVTLNGGTMSTATAQTLIDNMSYQNNSDTPSTSNRVITLTSIQDSGGTANDGDDTASLAVASTVTVVGVNDEPTLTATGSDPTFTEGGAAASLFSGTSIDTIESGQTITGLSFTITNITNGSNERINVDGTTVVLTHGTNGSTAGNSLNYSVMVIGTTATVTMTGGSLSSAAAETLINNMSYQNNSNSPSTSNRVVTLTSIQDSGGTANGGDNTGSLAVASTVTLVQINDAPTVSATSDDTMAAGGGSAVSIFSSTAISAVENEHIASVTFTVSGLVDTNSEKLNIDGSTVDLMTTVTATDATNGNIGYAVTYNSGTATVVITGTGAASAANTVFQTALDNMTYENTLGAVTTGNRVFTITEVKDVGGTANNGDDTWSTGITSTVTVLDATKPAASNYTDSGTEDTAVNLSATELPTAEDIGNEAVEYITIDTSTVTGGTLSLDSSGTAGTSTVGGINYHTTAGNLSGTVHINIADIGKLDFTPTDNLAGTGAASFDWSVTDEGGQVSSTATYTLDLTNTPDDPSGTDKTLPLTRGASHTFSASDFGFTDADTGDTLTRVQVNVQTIDNGTLKLDGVAVTDGQWIALADIGKLVYSSTATGGDSFTFTVEDSTNAQDQTPNTLSLNVTAPPPPTPEPEPQPESEEDLVTSPTGVSGDGNDDGVPDRDQADVASIPFRDTPVPSQEPNADPIYVSLTGGTTDGKSSATGSGVTLSNVRQLDKPDDDEAANLDMPLGLIAFDADIEEVGGTETFSLYVDDTLSINGYWKQNASGKWVNLASADYNGKVVLEGSKLRLDFQITDGGEFDADGEANGTIVDPGALAFGSEDYTDLVQSLYIAYYQRPADSGGLDYWVDYLIEQDGSLENVVDAFANSEESQALYGEITNTSISGFLGDLYRALFDRSPEVDGLMFYRNAFLAGEYEDGRPATAGTLMLDILQGAQNSDAELVELKLEAARTFTWLLDPDQDGEVMATFDASDLNDVRDWLQDLAGSDTAPGVGAIYSLIKDEVAEYGEPITLTGANGATELLF